MSAPAFTPGPWELKPWQVGAEQRHRAIWAAMAPGYNARGVLAHTMGQRPSWVNEANAHLIAAAPELYEALAEIAKGEGAFNRDPLIHAENTIESMKEIAIAALAKAKGQ